MKRRPGIYKRGNIYWITYTWQGRQYFESSHSSNIHDAEALLLKKKAELVAGRKPVRLSETLTFDELLDSYITQIEHPATPKRYRLSQSALSPICGTWRITDVDAFTFDRFKKFRIKEGVSPAGVNRDVALARAAFNFAVERRMLLYSPLAGVKLFNEAKHRKPPRAISCTEEPRILMCCDTRLRLIVIVLLYTGMRVGSEALRLKWADVDFEEAAITVAQSKTAAGLRALPMTEFVASELVKWHAATKGISEYVFFNPQRPSTHIHSVKTAWHNALKLAGSLDSPFTSVATLSRPDLRDWVCRTRLSTSSLGIRHEACSGSIRHESPNISETRSICWKNCEALRQCSPAYGDRGAGREGPNPKLGIASPSIRRLALHLHYNFITVHQNWSNPPWREHSNLLKTNLESGGGGRTRTYDLRIMRPSL